MGHEIRNRNGKIVFCECESLLETLADQRVLSIDYDGQSEFTLREACDYWYCVTFTPAQLKALGEEIIALAETYENNNQG